MYTCLCFFTMLSNPWSEFMQSGARNFQQCFWPHTMFPNWPFDQLGQMENSPKIARWWLALWARLRYFICPPRSWQQLQTCKTSSYSLGRKWQIEKCSIGRCPHPLSPLKYSTSLRWVIQTYSKRTHLFPERFMASKAKTKTDKIKRCSERWSDLHKELVTVLFQMYFKLAGFVLDRWSTCIPVVCPFSGLIKSICVHICRLFHINLALTK